MKKIFFIIVTVVTVCGCNNNATNNTQIINEPDSIRYYEARELKGLYEFILNETTIKDLKKIDSDIKEIDKNNNRINSYLYYTPYIQEIKRDDLFNGGNWCDMVHKFDVSTFNIGNIEIFRLKLTFFNDTLVNIECSPNHELKEAFITKYGKGFDRSKPTKIIKSKDKEIVESLDDITWENETVNAQYYYDFYEHPIYKGQQEAYKYFRISLKDTAIINAMNECNRKYREDLQNTEEKEKQDNIKKL